MSIKVIAIPFKEEKAAEARAVARLELEKRGSISAAEKEESLKNLRREIEGLARKVSDARAADVAEEVTKSAADELEETVKDLDQQILAKEISYAETQASLTHEEKAQALAELSKQDDDFRRNYGPQKLTQEEIQQQQLDSIAHEEWEKNDKYKDDRAAAYPPISEQLDAIMKWVFTHQGQVNFSAELISVAGRCMQVKAEFPSPKPAASAAEAKPTKTEKTP